MFKKVHMYCTPTFRLFLIHNFTKCSTKLMTTHTHTHTHLIYGTQGLPRVEQVEGLCLYKWESVSSQVCNNSLVQSSFSPPMKNLCLPHITLHNVLSRALQYDHVLLDSVDTVLLYFQPGDPLEERTQRFDCIHNMLTSINIICFDNIFWHYIILFLYEQFIS